MTSAAGARGVVRLREDVHVHARAGAVQRRILALETHDEWLAAAFRDYHADGEGFSFDLALPGRAERARLRRDGVEAGAVVFARDGEGAYESITWALHAETATEVHVTLEAVYRPARGPLGGALETLVHRPHRAQALRDSLWRLKQLLEAEQAAPPPAL